MSTREVAPLDALVDTLKIIGLNPIVIDENTDFTRPSLLPGHRPWDNEPASLRWTDAATGYKCYLVRSPLGSLCGYVKVPHNHPWRGKKYYGKNIRGRRYGIRLELRIEVHGGITFSGKPRRSTGGSLRGHWFGFDCAHFQDMVPALVKLCGLNTPTLFEGCVYRDVSFVKAECAKLAGQLRRVSRK